MKMTFGAVLLASLGSTVLWLLLVPAFQIQTGSNSLVGFLGMERQVLGVLGAMIVGVWADGVGTVKKFRIVQLLQLILACGFLIVLLTEGSPGTEFVLIWTAFRFALVGAISILAFKLFADASGSQARGAILQMVTSPQGAMVIASIVCALIPIWVSESLIAALGFDIVASILVLALLRGRAKTEQPIDGIKIGQVAVGMRAAVIEYWGRSLWPWNLLQLVFLVGLSGMLVYASVVARAQDLLPAAVVFPAAWFFYGLAFWLTAPLLKTPQRTALWCRIMLAVLLLCGVLGILFAGTNPNGQMLIYIALTFVNAFWIHFTNTKIIERAPRARISQIRAGMVLYLGVVFGVGEQLVGLLLSLSWGLSGFALLHLLAAIALYAMLRFANGSGTPLGAQAIDVAHAAPPKLDDRKGQPTR